jgi:hypothetical protein
VGTGSAADDAAEDAVAARAEFPNMRATAAAPCANSCVAAAAGPAPAVAAARGGACAGGIGTGGAAGGAACGAAERRAGTHAACDESPSFHNAHDWRALSTRRSAAGALCTRRAYGCAGACTALAWKGSGAPGSSWPRQRSACRWRRSTRRGRHRCRAARASPAAPP